MFSLDSLVFLIASLATLTLIYFKVPTGVFQQAIVILLILLLIVSKRFVFTHTSFANKLFRSMALTLSALFVQLLVISSGGFYSPFLILLHLYTLGVSFLLKIGSATSFLLLAVIVLVAGTILNPTLLFSFKQDPGSAILYFVSFIVIIPLAQFLMSTYHLKDTLSKLLTEYIAVGEKREQSILQGLNELVLVTDTNLKIISFNEVVRESLSLPATVVGNNLLSVLHLTDKSGHGTTLESLSIDQVLANRVAYVVKGFELETKVNKHLEVSIQIEPITNLAGVIKQIAFVLTDARVAGLSTHSMLEQARKRQELMLDNLKVILGNARLSSAQIQVLLLGKMEEDLLIAQDLQDHPFKQRINYQDLAELMLVVKTRKESLAKALHIPLQFSLSKDETQEAAYLDLKKSNVSASLLPSSEFSVPTNTKWLTILLEKLIDISILLCLGAPNPTVTLSLRNQDNRLITASIASYPVPIKQSDKPNLLKEYYGNLGATTNLRLGSGLEGFIAKTVASELKLPLEIQINRNVMIMSIQVSRGV